jgi:hypothetical protein
VVTCGGPKVDSFEGRRQCRQVQIVHHDDLPSSVILCHHEVQQPVAVGTCVSLRIRHARHIPVHIHCGNVRANEPYLDLSECLMGILENSGKYRGMEFFEYQSRRDS